MKYPIKLANNLYAIAKIKQNFNKKETCHCQEEIKKRLTAVNWASDNLQLYS